MNNNYVLRKHLTKMHSRKFAHLEKCLLQLVYFFRMATVSLCRLLDAPPNHFRPSKRRIFQVEIVQRKIPYRW